MMIRVNGEYLDCDVDIELVRQAKLFEEIDGTLGDFSYSFEIPITSNNIRILTFPFADVASKQVYQNIECDIIDNDGIALYKGSLRVEKLNTIIKCSFFSGNTNWISSLSGKISDLDFSEYDTILNKTNVQNSWSLSDGVKFPFLDTGNILSRAHGRTVIEDWSPCIFVKTIFNKIFQYKSIKIQGELIDNPLYNSLLVSTNTKDQNEIDDNTAVIGKTSEQHFFFASPDANEVIIWDDDSSYPFHNTVDNGFDLINGKFVSSISAKFKIQIDYTSIISFIFNTSVRKNGTIIYTKLTPSQTSKSVLVFYVSMNPGDYIDFVINPTNPALIEAIVYTATLTITPFFNYDIKGSSVVPKWTQQDFVRSIISLFNVVTDYDPYSKTITFNLFDRIKAKESVDISNYVTVYETDYTEFVSNYGKNNYFLYTKTTSEDLKKYNVKNFIEYGNGNIEIDNAYLPQSVEVLKSDLSSPVSYINKQFGNVSVERLNLLQLTNSDSINITSIVDDSGVSKFNVSDDIIRSGDLVKIETDSGDVTIDGEWVVSSVGTGYFEVADIPYSANDTGKVTILITSTSSNDDVFLLVDTGIQAYSDMSTTTYLYIDNTPYILLSTAFFNLLDTGLPITNQFKQGLSFGSINNPLSYQRNLLETFWNSFRLIMNDPAKIFVEATLPKKTYLSLSPLNPVFVKTLQSSNQYYINKTTGYKNSYTPCIMELIKL